VSDGSLMMSSVRCCRFPQFALQFPYVAAPDWAQNSVPKQVLLIATDVSSRTMSTIESVLADYFSHRMVQKIPAAGKPSRSCVSGRSRVFRIAWTAPG
jgi:hypothetical protein